MLERVRTMKSRRMLVLGMMATGGLLAAVSAVSSAPEGGSGPNWPMVNGDSGGSRYSRLNQINRSNVTRLRLAWTYHTGDADAAKATNIECTPVVVDGTMFVTTCNPRVKVVALDAATGIEKWKFDPWLSAPKDTVIASGGVNRGVAYWSNGTAARVLIGTADGRLLSLDAKTGHPDPKFGREGSVDLREGIERDIRRLPYGCTSAPSIYRDLAILGFANGEGSGPGAPGDVRAFNVQTGKEVWRFRTVPKPGEFGHDTWEGEGWRDRGGCNSWSGATVDSQRGVVYVGTGSPAFDFYGGDRKGDNLFGNCTIALDANTGKRIWHYQLVRHDLWDYDCPTPPVLCDVRRSGESRPAVAQLTKTGYVWVFDRKTGEPLFPVERRKVPVSDVPGEASSPYQLVPLKPPAVCKQSFGLEDVTDLSPEGRAHVLSRLKSMDYGKIFTPTTFRDTVRVPGFLGGANWSGAAYDPTSGRLYLNSNNIPREHRLEKVVDGSAYPYRNTGYGRFVDHQGYPAIKPPWGLLTAIDLSRGSFAWQKVLGEYPELMAKGLPPTGTESLGGPIVTAGGLVFIAGTRDEKLRAFDKKSGEILWQTQLPAAGYATPCTYSVGGRQYVAVAAGGGGKLATKSGDSYVAFALPRE